MVDNKQREPRNINQNPNNTRKMFQIEVRVQYRDIDSAGHVNNAVYLHFLEEMRMAFLKKIYGKYTVQDIDFVLAGLTINYHSRAAFDEILKVQMRICRIGTTSWAFKYMMMEKVSGRLIVDGESTQVLFDYTKGKKRAIPIGLKKKLSQFIN